jgi:hypothetical protein
VRKTQCCFTEIYLISVSFHLFHFNGFFVTDFAFQFFEILGKIIQQIPQFNVRKTPFVKTEDRKLKKIFFLGSPRYCISFPRYERMIPLAFDVVNCANVAKNEVRSDNVTLDSSP